MLIDTTDLYRPLYAYAHACDSGDRNELEQLFALQCRYSMAIAGSATTHLEGRDEIVQFLVSNWEGQRGTCRRHYVANPMVVSESATTWSVSSYLMVTQLDSDSRASIRVTGQYEDELVLEEGIWRFHTRQVTVDALATG